jgi:hypothetical protein
MFIFPCKNATIKIPFENKIISARRFLLMRQSNLLRLLVVFLLISVFAFNSYSQKKEVPPEDVTIVYDDDSTPSIMKALPDLEKVKESAIRIKNTTELKKTLGEQKVFDLIEFIGGTEGVAAEYPAGKLLVIEFQTPQSSVDADNKIKQFLSETPPDTPIAYRRVGNYSVFVFEGKDEAAANALLEQVKYEKVVQWLGEDPNYLKKAERYFARQASSLFVSTVLFIAGGILFALILGGIVGILYFKWRKKQAAQWTTYSDAGGMIRLNLDDLSEVIDQS